MEEKLAPRVTVAVHAPPRAFAPGVRQALLRLGYDLVTPDTALALARKPGPLRPALRIVDDRQLDRAPLETGAGALPLVLLVGRGRLAASDARAVGSVRRRARLEPLFEVFQRALEATPRSVPRAPTSLPLRALRGERAWAGAIRSLSEKGCLVEGARGIERDLRVELCFPIPGRGLIHVPAQASQRRRDGRVVLVFRDASRRTREAISGFVHDQLIG